MTNFKKTFLFCFISGFLACINFPVFAATDSINIEKLENKLPTKHWTAGPSISSNPAAVNVFTGTDGLQELVEKKLGIKNNHGIHIGGALLGDANYLFSGGIPDADKWTFNGLLLVALSVDTEKMMGLKGGLFDIEFLQFNGQKTNEQAGSVQGYNSLPGPPPLNRSELYQLWYRQSLFNDKFIIRIGKSVPTFDFDNVIKPVSLNEDKLKIPAVSGLIYTPLFVNTSLLGVMPGYYNSAYGLTLSFAPTHQWYVSYGVYDGSLAQGNQTGLTGPTFDGAYFQIAETGFNWLLGINEKPGSFGVGAWNQSGLIGDSPSLTEHGASGGYLFATQRLWYKHPGQDISGVSSFVQYGQNNSSVLPMTKYVGLGLTGFGLVANRMNDSLGIGAALSWLNPTIFSHRTELMFQTYYQAQVFQSVYLEPAISYIPTPGAETHLNAAWAGTLRAIVLF